MKNMVLLLILISYQVSFASRGMQTLSKDFSKVENNSMIAVPNMPRVLSQDDAGICYAFSAKTLYDHAICKSRNIGDCAASTNNQTASALDIVRFRNNLVTKYNEEIKQKNIERAKKGQPPLKPITEDEIDTSDRFNYEGLDLERGGDTAYALQNILQVGSVIKESCAPFDKMVSQLQDPAQAKSVNDKMWSDFKKQFQDVKSGKSNAESATKKLRANYCIEAPEADVLSAFSQDTYDNFLDKLLIPDECWDAKNSTSPKGDWSMDIFPRKDTPKNERNYQTSLKKLKENLSAGQPIAISFCSEEPLNAKSVKQCKPGLGHSVVIAGYQRRCDSKNSCRDVVKIQNSWGKSWQEANDDGWVDAKTLLDRTFYEPQSLVWMQPTN